MNLRTLALAGALTLGIGGTAMAQGVFVDTPVGGFGVGVGPGPYVYDDGYGYGPSYGPTYYGPRYYAPAPYPLSRQGDRVDQEIFSGYAGPRALQDDYENQTGINGN
jgi:hypothetical protein